MALYGSISFEQITGKKSPCDSTIVCYTPFQSCKAEDFSSLFNVALSNFESVDVYLVFPDTSCHFDARKKNCGHGIKHCTICGTPNVVSIRFGFMHEHVERFNTGCIPRESKSLAPKHLQPSSPYMTSCLIMLGKVNKMSRSSKKQRQFFITTTSGPSLYASVMN